MGATGNTERDNTERDNTEWREVETFAWTEGDGPGRPPGGPNRLLTTVVGGGLAAAFTAMIATDTLCPEHRAWVMTLATLALAATVTAAVGLLRGWAIAGPLALVATVSGMAIGMIDAVHDVQRGRAITATFAALTAGALVLLGRQVALLRWERQVRRGLPTGAAAAAGEASADDATADETTTVPPGADATSPADADAGTAGARRHAPSTS
ncbi:MAG TPA: hypothetical protein VIL36_18910 [Acidimicrobiales bacterium]